MDELKIIVSTEGTHREEKLWEIKASTNKSIQIAKDFRDSLSPEQVENFLKKQVYLHLRISLQGDLVYSEVPLSYLGQ